MDNRQDPGIQTQPGKGYALSGKIMLSAIVVLFAVVIFMVGLHLYARWYLVRLRQRQIERRRQRRGRRTHIVFYNNNENNNNRPAGDRGLELAVINSLPYFMYSSAAKDAAAPPPECSVCLSEFEEKEILRHLPKCDHTFHLDCIDMWFMSHSTCPLCRSGVEVVPEIVKTAAQPAAEGSSSSGCGCECNGLTESTPVIGGETTSLGERRKAVEMVGVRIEVPPRRRAAEIEGELTQSSPASRLLSRILSMGRKSPSGAGTSRGAAELDLESGPSESAREPSRFQTPV